MRAARRGRCARWGALTAAAAGPAAPPRYSHTLAPRPTPHRDPWLPRNAGAKNLANYEECAKLDKASCQSATVSVSKASADAMRGTSPSGSSASISPTAARANAAAGLRGAATYAAAAVAAAFVLLF